MKEVFIVGNKRSGSTHLMRLLNLHPEIYVSNESDIIWILYNFHNGKQIIRYPHDSDRGMNKSLKEAQHLLNAEKSVKENFITYQKYLMEIGFNISKPFNKTNLKYLGDQKPYQNIDPDLMPFILEHFPNAKFLHILRHPFEVIKSSLNFQKEKKGDSIWTGMTPEQVFKRWEMHELWVQDAISKYQLNILQVRYDRILKNPSREMDRIFQFLEVKFTQEILDRAKSITKANYKNIFNYKVTKSQKDLLQQYGLKTSFSRLESTILPKLKRLYAKLY